MFRNFQRHNLGRAAEHFGLTVAGPPSFGWRLRSIGAPTVSPEGPRWLRVVSEEPQWAHGSAWTGNADANSIGGIAKPQVLDVFEWSEHAWRNQRAEVMTVVVGQPCSPTDVAHAAPKMPDAWWSDLRRAVDTLARTPTDREHADQERVSDRVHRRFGGSVDTTVAKWTTAHGDLHWSNLMSPLGLLDWELWGMAPSGTDAATLLCYSLLVPEVAARVHQTFADVLETPTGRVAQLYVTARLLRRADGGDHPELAEPLARHATALLGR